MYSNLSLCSAMLFLSDHWMTFSRSRWSSLTSFSDLTAIEILVSSAKHLTMECIMQFSMSLMNIRKRMGPRTVPWGTPLMMVARRDKWPSTTTACFRFDRKDSIQFMMLLFCIWCLYCVVWMVLFCIWCYYCVYAVVVYMMFILCSVYGVVVYMMLLLCLWCCCVYVITV